MGRGRDKIINERDLRNMSPQERGAVMNMARMGRVRVNGSSVVRGKDGNVKYTDPNKAGRYNEDKL